MRRIPLTLYVASAVFSAGLALVAALSARTLLRTTAEAEVLALRPLETARQTQNVDDLLVQHGLLTSAMITRDPGSLRELQTREKTTRAWLGLVAAAPPPGQQGIVDLLRRRYDEWVGARDAALAAWEAGERWQLVEALDRAREHMNAVVWLSHQLLEASRLELQAALDESRGASERGQLRISLLAAGVALLGIGLGALMARRIARPIYELILRVENAEPGGSVRLADAPRSAHADELTTLVAHIERLLARLSDQRRRLMQAEKMQAVGEIAAKLAHEILNPVAAVKAALQSQMRMAALPPPSREVLGEADRTLTRVASILQRLVRYSRPLEPHARPCDVGQMVQSALSASAHALQACGVTAQPELPALPQAQLDPDLVAQVLTNLVVNAAQASPAGERVRVAARRAPGALVLEVADRGCGLPKARDRLFQPFFTTREGGNGLGLAVSRNIVAEHGGVIEARDGEDGHGAVFVVTLPQEGEAWVHPS